jgi:hypothetical protein
VSSCSKLNLGRCAYQFVGLKQSLETSESWLSVSPRFLSDLYDSHLTHTGGGSEEIMSELAIREEVKDLRRYAQAVSKL